MFDDLRRFVSDKTKIVAQKQKINAMSTQQKLMIGAAFAASVALNVVLIKQLTKPDPSEVSDRDWDYLNSLMERDRAHLL